MSKFTLYQEAVDEQCHIHGKICAVSAQWLAEHSGVPIKRIYEYRQNPGKKIPWAELQAIRRAIRSLSDVK